VDCVPPLVMELALAGPITLVNAKLVEGLPPLSAATTLYEPECEFAVAVIVTSPSASLVPEVALNDDEAPVPGDPSVTIAPCTALLPLSFTRNCSVVGNALPTVCDWPPPWMTLKVEAALFVLVSPNNAGEEAPEVVAVTLYAPATEPAVAAVLACPLASVVIVVELKLTLAPDVGPENVTVFPGTTFPALSFTVATS
jgi:hypothetical protein